MEHLINSARRKCIDIKSVRNPKHMQPNGLAFTIVIDSKDAKALANRIIVDIKVDDIIKLGYHQLTYYLGTGGSFDICIHPIIGETQQRPALVDYIVNLMAS